MSPSKSTTTLPHPALVSPEPAGSEVAGPEPRGPEATAPEATDAELAAPGAAGAEAVGPEVAPHDDSFDAAASAADDAATPQTPAGPLFLRRVESPIGRLEIISDGSSITSLVIERAGSLPHDSTPESTNAVLDDAARQLTEYFAGERRDFDLPVQLQGTEFQKSVWRQLGSLGWGETSTYGQIGTATGRPTAGRAVGGAVGANPVPIIVGCHRVLASDGRITGYSGGNGIPTKVWLLEHEGIEHA